MKQAGRASASRSTILGVGLLYLLLMALVLFFSRQFLLEVSFPGSAPRILLLVLAALVPLFLLAMIVANVLRVIRERAADRPGTRFKLRLILFFLAVIVLAALPQAFLSVNVTNASMRSLFDTGTERALRGGLDVALQFYDERVAGLRDFVRGERFEAVAEEAPAMPAETWERLQRLYPTVDGFQVVSPEF